MNKSRNKKNLPPTGEGKKQSPLPGKPKELDKRSEVLQAQRNRPEQNIGTVDEEMAVRSPLEQEPKRKRQKAGR